MPRPDIRKFVVPNNVLDPWDRVPWNDIEGKPAIYIPSGEIFETRQYKYIFDGLRAANLNTTLVEEEGYARLITTIPYYLRDKTMHQEHVVRLGLPALTHYSFDRANLRKITTPIIMKPKQGKNSYDRHIRNSYRVFNNGNALLAALNQEGIPFDDVEMNKRYFIEDSAANLDGSVNKILAMVLINGNKQVRCFHVDEQVWTPRVRTTNLDLAIRRPTTTIHNAPMEQMAQKFADEFYDWGLKNCCLYLQCIIKDGVYYYNDADICIPKVYAVALNKYLPEHLNFMFDQVSDITIPTEYVVTKTLTSLKGAKETHLDLLESRAAQHNAFYWVQRFNFNPADEVGRYMLITSGDTEEQAMDTMNAWVEYLTV